MKRLALIILLLASLPAVLCITINTVLISPTNPTVSTPLSCFVNATGTGVLSANITWYNDSTLYTSDTEIINLTTDVEATTTIIGTIEIGKTIKGQVWKCQATISNTTDTLAGNSTGVTIRNSPPVITTPPSSQSATEDSLYNQAALATDPDGDTIITYISSDLNASNYAGNELFTIANNGQITFTPDQSQNGNHTVAILAFDGTDWGGQNILFTVDPFNDAPIFSPSLTNTNATAEIPFSIIVTGWDEESDPFNFSMTTNSTTLIITQITNTTANITFPGGAPAVSDRGTYQVNVTVYDTSNQSRNTTQTFILTVTAINKPPVLLTILTPNGTQGNLFTLSVNATDNDTADNLFFSITTNCSLTNPWSITTTDNSSNATGLISMTLTNNHVICRYVTITVKDYESGSLKGGSANQTVFFNITNTNDPPVVENTSDVVSNTRSQTNITNLTAAPGIPFLFTVKATDPDQLTYQGDSITFTDNSPLFTIGATTGLISFTPNITDAGTYSITITATDSNGSTGTGTMNLTIVANNPPSITPVSNIVCQQGTACIYDFTATDNDLNENLAFTSNTSLVTATPLTYNTSRFNKTYTNNDVGNYSVLLTVSDFFDHTNTTIFNLTINNTNDAPFFDNNYDNISDVIAMPTPVVVGYKITWLINATDPDFRNVYENLTFTAVITAGPNLALFTINKISQNQANITFTPGLTDFGAYTVNVTVTDLAGLNDSRLVNFTVVNASVAPVITGVQPYWNGTTFVMDALTVPVFDTTSITLAENTNVSFNISYTDPDTAAGNIVITYALDGYLLSTKTGSMTNLTYYFNYFSAGSHSVVVTVSDNLLNQDTFTWNILVSNVNRAPVLLSTLSNRTINATTILADEMTDFIDPDDDLNSNNMIDGAEINTLTFTMPDNDYLVPTFDGFDLTLAPKLSGTTTTVYTATDALGLTAISNTVGYTVFYNQQQSQDTTSNSNSGRSSSSGGGGSVIPIPITRPKPYAIDIITPKPITIYENNTLVAPLAITNTGTMQLTDIKLSAKSSENVTLTYLEDTIDSLQVNETMNTSLFITGFKDYGTYEIYVTAAVTNPAFNDSAVFYVNSIEKGSTGEVVNTKVTYARDLLTANPACGELTQLVEQAQQAYRNSDEKTGDELLSAVTQGCTYLKAQAAKEVQAPTLIQSLAGFQYTNVFLGGLLVLLLVIGGSLVLHYGRQ